MQCENCSCEHRGEYGSGRFCCVKCARSFATKARRTEISQRVSKTLQKPVIQCVCAHCGMLFVAKHRRKRKHCSRTCAAKAQWTNPALRKRWSKQASNRAKQRHTDGDLTFGWSTRKRCEPSYPEQIAMRVLDELDVIFEREFRVGKYFIDFAIHERKLAIEIDGRQHEKPERQQSDRAKDALLQARGWKVVRIKYPDENVRQRLIEILV